MSNDLFAELRLLAKSEPESDRAKITREGFLRLRSDVGKLLAAYDRLRAKLVAAEQRVSEWEWRVLDESEHNYLAIIRADTIEQCARVCDADFAEAPWREANELAMQIRQLVSTSERTDRGSS